MTSHYKMNIVNNNVLFKKAKKEVNYYNERDKN